MCKYNVSVGKGSAWGRLGSGSFSLFSNRSKLKAIHHVYFFRVQLNHLRLLHQKQRREKGDYAKLVF